MTNDKFNDYAARYMDMVFRLACNYLKNQTEADDVTQNVMLRLLQTPRNFESDEHVRNWLIRVTINECKNVFRAFQRRPEEPLESFEEISDSCTQADGYGTFSNDTAMLEAVMKLPAKYRVILYLYYYEKYDTREIAGLLKLPPSTVRTRLVRARERLKKILEEDDEI